MTAAAIHPGTGPHPIRYPRAMVLAFTSYVLVVVARVHEIVPVLNPLKLGMITSLLTFFLAMKHIRRESLSEALRSAPGRGLLVVVAFTVLTIPTAAWPKASFDYLRNTYYHSVLLFVFAAALFADRQAARTVGVALVLAVGFAGGIASGHQDAGRWEIGMTYDPNETAALLVMTIPWAVYVVLTERKILLRILGGLTIAASIYGVLRTGSRGGLLGTAALVPFLLYLAPPKRRGPFIGIVTLAAIVTVATIDDTAIYRLRKAFDTSEYNYTTEDGRIEIWKRGLGYVKSSPILGAGVDGFQYRELAAKSNRGYGIRQAAAHNMYIQVAAELGLVGFGGFLTMLFGAQVILSRARKRLKAQLGSGNDDEAARAIVLVNMAQASAFSLLCTGFFLSLGYAAMVYFSVGSAVGLWLSTTRSTQAGARPMARTVPLAPGRGWRSARLQPVGAGLHTPGV